jgi:tetratricopeptide (TPR) repeat protein
MNAAAKLQKAISSENRGDLAGAMAEYQKVVRREPANIDALFLLGRAHCQQGQLTAGADLFRKVVKLKSDHVSAHTLLGMALFRLGKPEEALVSLEQALAVDPRFELALASKADVLAELGRHDDAVAEYDKALAVNGGNFASWCNRGNALQSLRRDAEAVESFQRALAINANLAEAHFNLANALHRLRRSEQALPHYRRAIALRPGLAGLYLNFAGVLIILARWEEAAQISEQAIKLEPNSARAHYHLGNALFELGQYDQAMAHIDKALELDPDNAGALHDKARYLIILGRVEQAQVLLKRAVELDPQRVASYVLLSEIRRFAPDDPLLLAMERLLSGRWLPDSQDRIDLQFAVAKTYNDIGKHEKSFKRLLEANALMRQRINYEEDQWLRQFNRIKQIFTFELLHRKSEQGDPSHQPIFIVGMPRSGSTLIEQVLASHPRVYGAGERHDFWRVLIATTGAPAAGFPELVLKIPPQQLNEIGAAYIASMTKSLPSVDRFTDKQLGNFIYVGMIRLALPNARIIHVQRNPIDTCWSCFSLRFSEQLDFAYDLGELGRFYRAYEGLMEHWRKVLPEGAMLDVRYEDVIADVEIQARRIIDYCGLEWDDACLAFYETARPVRTASVAQVRQPIYKSSVERWRPYERHLGPLLEALGRPL